MIRFDDYLKNPVAYEEILKEEMIKLGATKLDLFLITKEFVWNNFEKKRSPKDVAWAIMQ